MHLGVWNARKVCLTLHVDTQYYRNRMTEFLDSLASLGYVEFNIRKIVVSYRPRLLLTKYVFFSWSQISETLLSNYYCILIIKQVIRQTETLLRKLHARSNSITVHKTNSLYNWSFSLLVIFRLYSSLYRNSDSIRDSSFDRFDWLKFWFK